MVPTSHRQALMTVCVCHKSLKKVVRFWDFRFRNAKNLVQVLDFKGKVVFCLNFRQSNYCIKHCIKVPRPKCRFSGKETLASLCFYRKTTCLVFCSFNKKI